MISIFRRFVIFFLVLCCAAPTAGDVTVFLDFSADWLVNLDQAANDAQVPTFNTTEIAQIESFILSQFIDALAPFDVEVTTTDPGPQVERIDYGAMTNIPGLLGQSPVDFLNAAPTTASVFTANFSLFIENDEPRATQLEELSFSLAGTGIHELGHSFGMRHHAAYGDPRITPANYGNTQGFQNEHYIATGPTGLSEPERERPRTFSQWSTVLMEATLNLTPNPLPLQLESGDAGDDPASAQFLDTTPLVISDTESALVFGQLDSVVDVDVFAFEVQNPMRLTAEIYSQGLFFFPDSFDSLLRLYDADGTSMLGENDNVWYEGDVFDGGVMRETDSFLLNILIPEAGTYFLEVSASDPLSDPLPGGFYELIFAAAAVPEPTGLMVWVAVGAGLFLRLRASAGGARTSPR